MRPTSVESSAAIAASSRTKDVVIGVRERGGPIRLVQTPDNKTDTVYQVIADHVAKDAKAIMTDESPIYNFETTQFHSVRHERIKHKAKIYVRAAMFTRTPWNPRSHSSSAA